MRRAVYAQWYGHIAPIVSKVASSPDLARLRAFHTLTYARRRRAENSHAVTFEKPCIILAQKVGSNLLLCYNAKRRPKIARNLYVVQFSLLARGYHEKSIGYR
jgi:hypothetical protein